jgi:glycosyltransferase involved in cell wall biosynthesis
MNASVCIITPGYLASTPRVVKEADALAEAGFTVRVVHGAGALAAQREMDRDLAISKPWTAQPVDWSGSTRPGRRLRMLARLRNHLWRRAPLSLLRHPHRAALAYGHIVPELARLAAAAPADLYLGHYPDGLAAAARAADLHRARLGFDAEDLHGAESPEAGGPSRRDVLAARLLAAHLPRCAHVSASSVPIAAELARRYSPAAPVAAVHNAFPLSLRSSAPPPADERGGTAPSLYWFSQYIGPGRGLDHAVMALRRVQGPWRLHLRGDADPAYVARLRALLGSRADDLVVHPYAPPGEMISRASAHDIGLALEEPVSLSRRLCATNKLFTYYLAGLAMLATDLPGQRSILSATPGAALLCPPGDIDALVALLERLLDPSALRTARAAAAAGALRWNWERESETLLASVAAALGPGGP